MAEVGGKAYAVRVQRGGGDSGIPVAVVVLEVGHGEGAGRGAVQSRSTGGHAFVLVPYPLASVSPSRPTEVFVSSESPMLKPLCVPGHGEGPRDRVPGGVLDLDLDLRRRRPVAAIPVVLRTRSGSVSPHD